MGMIFNTDETLHLAKEANVAFRKAVINVFRNTLASQADWSKTFANLPGTGPKNPVGGTYDLITNKLPVVGGNQIWIRPANAGNIVKSQNWLKLFDTQINTKAKVMNEIVATTVGKAIAGVITDTSLHGVEFFVVPDSSTTISADYIDFSDKSGDVTRIITIHTNTVDTFSAIYELPRRGPARPRLTRPGRG